MITTFKLNSSELNNDFIESIKKLFFNKNIEIVIKADNQSQEIFSEKLIKSINNIENDENIKTFTLDEFQDFSKCL